MIEKGKLVDFDILDSPYGYIARIKGMVEQIDILLRDSRTDNYKMEYRIIKLGLQKLTKDFDYYNHGTWNPNTHDFDPE